MVPRVQPVGEGMHEAVEACVEIKPSTRRSRNCICSMACRANAIDARFHSCVCSMAFRLTKFSAIILKITEFTA